MKLDAQAFGLAEQPVDLAAEDGRSGAFDALPGAVRVGLSVGHVDIGADDDDDDDRPCRRLTFPTTNSPR